MSRIKQRPKEFGISKVQTGPARRPPARATRSNLQAQSESQAQVQSQQQSQLQPQQANTRLRRQVNGAAMDPFSQQDFGVSQEQRSGSVIFPPLNLVVENDTELGDRDDVSEHEDHNHNEDPEGLWALTTEEERRGALSADTSDHEALGNNDDIEEVGYIEGIEEVDDVEEAKETEKAGAAPRADEIEEVDAYEFGHSDQPRKRRRVALSASPQAAKDKGTSSKLRRQTIANVVQTISSAMAKASAIPAKAVSPLQPEDMEKVAEQAGTDDEEVVDAEADGGEEVDAEEQPNGQTQEGDVIVVTGSDDEEADEADEILEAVDAPGPDPNETDTEEDEGRRRPERQDQQDQQDQQEELEPTQTSQETRLTNGTGSAYADSNASVPDYQSPVRNQPPRKSAANPTINVPPEARCAAKVAAKPTAKAKPVAVEEAPQGVKRKRGRPRKIVVPITTEQEPALPENTTQRPARTSRKAAVEKAHPPPTQITTSSLKSTSQPREGASTAAQEEQGDQEEHETLPPVQNTTVSPSNPSQMARGELEIAAPQPDPDLDFNPEDDDLATSRKSPSVALSTPSEPIKVVHFPTDTVSSLVALMCRDGWTGQKMWKGTFRWYYYDGREMAGATYQAHVLMAELGKLEETYRSTPAPGDFDLTPRSAIADAFNEQQSCFEGPLYQNEYLMSSEQTIEDNLSAICETLLDSILPLAEAESRTTSRDAEHARRYRAIVADDLVSYVIPMVVCLLEAACCLGGRKSNGGLQEAEFSVPLKTVRITRLAWNRINQAAYWLVRLESALAQELGYREQRDGSALGLASADSRDLNSSSRARNTAQSNDRAHLKRLLNRLQDDLCDARNCFERNLYYEPDPQEPQEELRPVIDLTEVERDLDLQAREEAMMIDDVDDVDDDQLGIYEDTYGEIYYENRLEPASVASTPAKGKAVAKTKAKPKAAALRQQIAKPNYQQLTGSDSDPDTIYVGLNPATDALDETNSAHDAPEPESGLATAAVDDRAKSIEIILPPKPPLSTVPVIDVESSHSLPTSPSRSTAAQSIVPAEAAGEIIEDEAGATDENAADDAVADVIEVRGEAEVNGQGTAAEEEQELAQEGVAEEERASSAVAEKEKDKTPGPRKTISSHIWEEGDEDGSSNDDIGEPMMTTALPKTAGGASAVADSDEDSQGTSLFVRQHSEPREQQASVEGAADAEPEASAPTPAPAPQTPTKLAARAAPTVARKCAAKPIVDPQDSQDDFSAPSKITRDEQKAILTILRTRGASIDLAKLAAELGRDRHDVAKCAEAIKLSVREAALRAGKPMPAWARAGFMLNN